MAKVVAVSISKKKGTRKSNINKAKFRAEFGIIGDAHAGNWHRQVSFLAEESIERMKRLGLSVKSGDFAENITTKGIDLHKLKVGDKLIINDVVFIISQKGKICHHKCAIYHMAGDCIMPKEGIFAIVKNDGIVSAGDKIFYEEKSGFSVAVITLADKRRRGEKEDALGLKIKEYIESGLETSFVRCEMIPNERENLERVLVDFCDLQQFDLIITNSSNGASSGRIVKDVIGKVIEKELPDFGGAERMSSFYKTHHAIVSGVLIGTRGDSLIVGLTGSLTGAIESFELIFGSIPHVMKSCRGTKGTIQQTNQREKR